MTTPSRFLPGVPASDVEAAFNAAPGNEIASGKFDSPDSSAALAGNAIGFFLDKPHDLPPLPGCEGEQWPAQSVQIETTVRLPWTGGRHPVLDSLILTPSALIGIESKRYEPFREMPTVSTAYSRPLWGERMKGYESIRDALNDAYVHLNAAQLFKHAFALRTEAQRWAAGGSRVRPILFYLYAEPDAWASGKAVDEDAKARHRAEVARFRAAVSDDEVAFVACGYTTLLDCWASDGNPAVRAHAARVAGRYTP